MAGGTPVDLIEEGLHVVGSVGRQKYDAVVVGNLRCPRSHSPLPSAHAARVSAELDQYGRTESHARDQNRDATRRSEPLNRSS
jgi:hypothetical protein